MITYSHKTINDDFKVTEILNLSLCNGQYNYYLLCKNGFKTIDVIKMIAIENNIDVSNITYCGLKDEDAVTVQHIAVKNACLKISRKAHGDKEYQLFYLGTSDKPLEIGKLQGNSFSIRIRNLDFSLAKKVKASENHLFSIINYFGRQRFGMPNMPMLAHEVGRNLLCGKYELALNLLHQGCNIDCGIYKEWAGKGEKFWHNLEDREKTFFLSAFDSFCWNNKVVEILHQFDFGIETCDREGLQLVYISDINDRVRMQLNNLTILWHRFAPDGSICTKDSFRTPYIDVIYKASDVEEDDLYSGRYMIIMEFILPAGVYATNVIDQIMHDIGINN